MFRFAAFTFLGALTSLAAFAAPASAASFNCGGRLTHTEAAICDNGNLSQLDSHMASLYFTRRNQLHGYMRGQFDTDQRAWLGSRNSCGADVDCLTGAYTSRIHIMMVAY